MVSRDGSALFINYKRYNVMAKLRGEIGRLKVRTSAEGTDPEVYKNVAGEMTLSGSFDTATDVADTKDNESGFSIIAPTTSSGSLDLTAKYATDVVNTGDLVYKGFFERHKDKTKFKVQFDATIFTITAMMVVLGFDVSASNTAFIEYTVNLGYAETPTFTPKTT